jgi:site-specific recombinase XerD
MQGRLEHEIKIDNYISEKLSGAPGFVSEWHMNLKASKKTAATRKDFVCKILNFLSKVNVTDISQFNLPMIERYFISTQTKQDNNGNTVYTSDSYQQCVWIALNNFFGFLYKRNYISENFMNNIDKPRNHDLERINEHRVLLTKKDFKRIINAVENGTGSDTAKAHQLNVKSRDKLIMSLLMSTGMRESALTEINMSDIDMENKMLHIIDKGNKKHTYPLSDNIIDLINEWAARREIILDGENSDALLITEGKKRLTQNGLAAIVKKYTMGALGKALSPHKLRAGFCSILYAETGDAEFCRRAIGHSNISTTQRYITTGNNERKRASEIMSFI